MVPTEQQTFPPSQEDRLSLRDMANRKWEFTLAYFSQKKLPLPRSCRAPAPSLLHFTTASLCPPPPPAAFPPPGCSVSPLLRAGLGGRGQSSGPRCCCGSNSWVSWPGSQEGGCQCLINRTHPVLMTHKTQKEKNQKRWENPLRVHFNGRSICSEPSSQAAPNAGSSRCFSHVTVS